MSFENFKSGFDVKPEEFIKLKSGGFSIPKNYNRRFQGNLLTFQSYYFSILAVFSLIASIIQPKNLIPVAAVVAYVVLRQQIPKDYRVFGDGGIVVAAILLSFWASQFLLAYFFAAWTIVVAAHAFFRSRTIARQRPWIDVLKEFVLCKRSLT
ncbi:MAG: hypothetical protein EZS28_033572, partial [Streblomastix strix]